MTKYLTIAVTCYNSEDFIERCLNSILPVIKEVEVLVIDDGSQDRTLEIVESFVEAYPQNIQLIKKEHAGYGSAINLAMNLMTTPWFKLLDSDDYFIEEGLISLVELIKDLNDEKSSPELIVNDYIYALVLENGKEYENPQSYANVFLQPGYNSWSRVKNFNVDQILAKQAITYSHKILNKISLRLPEYSRYADQIYAYEPLPHVRRIYYLKDQVYAYTLGRPEQAASMQAVTDNIKEVIAITLEMFRRVRLDSVRPQKLQRYMYNHMARMIALSMIPLGAESEGINAASQQMELIWHEFDNINPIASRRLKAMPMLNPKRLISAATSYLNKNVYNLVGKVFIL